MRGYEVIDHTAEVGIVARGTTLPELFEVAAEAMFSFLIDVVTVENRAWRERTVEAEDRDGLLVAWLNDLLVLLNADAFLPKVFVIDELDDLRLRATVHGEPVDPTRHRFRLDVKAATYHALEIKHAEGGGWTARVVFDV